MRFEFDEGSELAKIKVIGVGGAGGNAVNRMVDQGLKGVEFLVVNTDAQVLEYSKAHKKIQIGSNLTSGLGSGGKPEIGEKAIEEDADIVSEMLEDSDMVFVTAGMGGGTGTGASPAIARVAREKGALTVGIVTIPFSFEGKCRQKLALEGINKLKEELDTLIVIRNDKLLSLVSRETPLTEAFSTADAVLHHATKGISDLVTIPGLINLDFADVNTTMSKMGDALMGTGVGSGEERAVEAARLALNSPLLDDVSIKGARGVLVNITGDEKMSLHEVSQATAIISDEAGDEANVIFGAVVNDNLDGEIHVTVIATGFDSGRSIIKPTRIDSARLGIRNEPEVSVEKDLEDSEIDINEFASVGASSGEVDLDVPTFLRKHHD
ncbi:MAG: cell division protein FtsZ [Candidatus Krumholzibacteriota bacterium]|nr:cell division protein FtsZ [Candidatus Krumholzibacteriota bacterium]